MTSCVAGRRAIGRFDTVEVFGELGLLHGAPRSATVVAEGDGLLPAFDGAAFLELVGSATSLRGRLLDLYEPAQPAT